MSTETIMDLLIALLPIAVFLIAALVIGRYDGAAEIGPWLTAKNLLTPRERRPLYIRFGYGAEEVGRYWGAFDSRLLEVEQRHLRVDLFFPVLYGGAMIVSLLWLRGRMGGANWPLWLLVPIGVSFIADWMENLVLLKELGRYRDSLHPAAIEERWIAVASSATVTKLVAVGLSWGLLVATGGWMAWHTATLR